MANLLALFGGGFEPEQHTCVDSRTLMIRLQAKAEAVAVAVCSHCAARVCGPSRERIPWLAGRRALTLAMVRWVEALILFAKRLKHYLAGIIASARYRLHNSVLEGMNNRIKVIKRMAYGYRESEYFFLKIRTAFPGKAR